jgi:hypothetical protein
MKDNHTQSRLIAPYGGKLVNLVVEGTGKLLARSNSLPSVKICRALVISGCSPPRFSD